MFFCKSGKERKYAVKKIPSAILNAAALLLQPYLPDLTPQKLETALAAKEKNAGELDLSRKLTRAECARILGVSVNSVHRYIQNGYLRAIKTFSEKLGHVPVIDPNPRRGNKVELAPARKVRYRERSTVERVNSDLKDNYGARHVRVKGHWKVLCHLMFGVIAITVKQLFNMLE